MKTSKNNLSKSLTRLDHLLKSNQYDEVSALFEKAQQYSEQNQTDDLWREISSVAREICCVCRIVHDEAEWYRHAAGEAERCENELKHSLSVIAHLAAQGDSMLFEQSSVTLPNFATTPSLWQRLASLLNQVTLAHSGFTTQSQAANRIPVNLPDDLSGNTPSASGHHHASLDFHCLGHFCVYLHGQPIDIGANRRAKSVLKYLVLHHTQPVSKEVLMDCFWPDADAESARNNLNVAVYNLRQALRKTGEDISYILFQDNAYMLNPAVDTWFDFEAFTERCEKARQFDTAQNVADALGEYKHAESLYTGPLFEEDRYEDWPVAHRNYLQDGYLQVLERLSQYAFSEGAYAECINLCSKMLMIDPCREEAHLRIMHCHSRQGQQHLALRQYQRCVEVLKKELDLMPGAEIASLYQRIRMSAIG